MGCCYSCKEDSASQGGEPNERSALLVDPVSNTSIQRVHRTVIHNEEDLRDKICDPDKTLREKLSYKVTVNAMQKRPSA